MSRVPRYRLHKASGRALVEINGRKYYLGKHGTSESLERYAKLIEFLASDPDEEPEPGQFDQSLTVATLAAKFLEHAKTEHYARADGTIAVEYKAVKRAVGFAVSTHAATLANQYGPVALKNTRKLMMSQGICREKINQHVSRIRRMFKWGVGAELIPVETWQALLSVEGLRKGAAGTHDAPPVTQVPVERVEAIENHVLPQVWVIVQFALWTGCRVGEACRVKMSEIDTSHEIWEFRPSRHKNAHRSIERVIFLGPHARKLIEHWKRDNPNEYLWQPTEARKLWEESRKRDNGRKKKPAKKRKSRELGEHYTPQSLTKAIVRGCERAFGMPDELRKIPKTLDPDERRKRLDAAAAWRAKHAWAARQLRHTAATKIRAAYGIEAARIILGHTSISTTEIYAERDREKAREVMTNLG